MSWLEKLGWGQSEKLNDFGFLGTDMHSHLLPGIDDGAPDLETSLQLIRELYDMGFRQIVTTPHVMADMYPNTPELIQEKLREVQAAVQETDMDVRLAAAAEYLLDDGFGAKMEAGDLLSFGDHYVLIEMSFISPPPQLKEYLFRLQTQGLRPILAHPERYEYYRGNIDAYTELQDRGCLLQVNLLSLTGYYGRSVRQTAQKLLQAGMVSFLGTDLHRAQHAQQLRSLLQSTAVAKMLEGQQFLNGHL